MAARPPRHIPTQPPYTTTHGGSGGGGSGPSAILRYLHNHFPNHTQQIGILTLVLTTGILLLLTGLGLTAAILVFIFFSPIILLTSPVWFPIAAFLFVVLSFFGFGVTAAAALTWLYRYFCGMHPPGSGRVDYARSRLANTARGVNDYAREYGGYLHSKIKDAAPGA